MKSATDKQINYFESLVKKWERENCTGKETNKRRTIRNFIDIMRKEINYHKTGKDMNGNSFYLKVDEMSKAIDILKREIDA